MFENMTLAQYNEILASKTPTPGGGSALAMVGTIACSLVEMSINVTLGKLDDSDIVKSLLQSHVSFFVKARNCLFQLSNDDAQAFRHIVDCMHLPQENSQQVLVRKSELQKAYHRATLVPLDVMRICREALNRAQNKVFPLLYKYVSSDCKIGINLFGNILENCMETVYANTTLITDKDIAAMLEQQAKEILGKN